MESSFGHALRVAPGDGKQTRDADRTAHDPAGAVVGQFLDAWIRSGRGFRGRQIWQMHTFPDGERIDRIRYLLLRELVYGDRRRLSDLAVAVGLTRSHASRVVDDLVRRGLATRTVPDNDRRVVIVGGTPAARDLMAEIDGHSRELIAQRLGVFTCEEAALFSALFGRFADEVLRWSAGVEPRSDRQARRVPGGDADAGT